MYRPKTPMEPGIVRRLGMRRTLEWLMYAVFSAGAVPFAWLGLINFWICAAARFTSGSKQASTVPS
jgi:hypothetical protein